MRKSQSGVMLLEALIAILIFSLGILGVVGMQASAVAASRDAKFRTDAGLLANELLGQMWASNRDGPSLQQNFQGDGEQADASNVVADGPLYAAWFQRVSATLPGVLANPPLVYVGSNPDCTPGPASLLGDPGPPATSNPRTSTPVCIVVRWRAPNDTTPHAYRVFVRII
jgi:type IV pilus assembly protein PilV